MHETEAPVVRPYLLVGDIEAAARGRWIVGGCAWSRIAFSRSEKPRGRSLRERELLCRWLCLEKVQNPIYGLVLASSGSVLDSS